MGLIIDSSVIIAGERGTLRFSAFLEDADADTTAIAAITASELPHGCHHAVDAGTRARRLAFVEAPLELIPVLQFRLIEARQHSEIWPRLSGHGTMIGAHDLLIAATSIAGGHELATFNRREFSRVPGLRLSDLAPGLRVLTRQAHPDPLIEVLDFAQGYTSAIDFSSYDEALAVLRATNVLEEPKPRLRLRVPHSSIETL